MSKKIEDQVKDAAHVVEEKAEDAAHAVEEKLEKAVNTPVYPTGKFIRRFLQMESSGGILLITAALIAIVFANTPMAGVYHAFLETPFTFSYGEFGISKPLILWINDGLMAIFFLMVGMEIKRELVEGELSTVGQAVLPFFGAAGGMIVPALIYVYFNWGSEETMRGWAIPSATDIAFSLAILGLFGSRAPLALKIFLTAVAVIDDLGAIVIIALFYTSKISLASLIIAGLCFIVLLILNLKGTRKFAPFIVVGLIMWVAVLKSGVHATIAGVVLGFMIPLKVTLPNGKSMLKYMEHGLHSWVAYLILPLFAFANSGVDFSGISVDHLKDPVPLGIALGLFVGKQLGIFLFASVLILAGFTRLPERCTWMQFYGVCILCGIGFTMSLFIGGLAFNSTFLLTETRLGVLLGSFASGVMGYIWLSIALRGGDASRRTQRNMRELEAAYPKKEQSS